MCSRMRSVAYEHLSEARHVHPRAELRVLQAYVRPQLRRNIQRASRRHGRRLATLQLFGPRATPSGGGPAAARSSSLLTLMAQSANEGAGRCCGDGRRSPTRHPLPAPPRANRDAAAIRTARNAPGRRPRSGAQELVVNTYGSIDQRESVGSTAETCLRMQRRRQGEH